MAEMNQFAFYSMNAGYTNLNNEDEIDNHVSVLRSLDEYQDVCDYINAHFENIESGKIIDYPNLNKQICITYKENSVEFCAAKNKKQFFGRGWLLVNKKNK